MQINTTHINSLLSKVKLIVNKYEEIERITGEKFNVFSILGLSSDELAHSKFIANLLNSKGTHGQGDIYLKLFIECMKEKFLTQAQENPILIPKDSNIHVLDLFETEKAICITEKHAGKVKLKEDEGGRIDIYLESSTNEIIIENKVYAGDQYKQLKRYNNFAPNAPIFYLSRLDSDKVSLASKKDLIEGVHFFSISYETDILNWIDKCVERSASIPFVRETLRQYSHLIKRLTNQETKSKMKNEFLKLFIGDENKRNMELVKRINEKTFLEDLNTFLLNQFAENIILEINKNNNFKKVRYNVPNYRTIIIEHDKLPSGIAFKLIFNLEGYMELGVFSIDELKDTPKLKSFIDVNFNIFQSYSFKVSQSSWVFYKKTNKKSPYSLKSSHNLMQAYYEDEFKNEFFDRMYEFIDPYLSEIKMISKSLK